MRRYLLPMLLLLLTFGSSLPARAAARPIQVFVNGQLLAFDVAPTIINGRTLVPVRAILEALGATVTWDQPSHTVRAMGHDVAIALTIGSDRARINGGNAPLDVPAQLIGDRTLVPLRFVGEAMGARVGWYNQSRAITINTPATAPVPGTVTHVVDGDTVDVSLSDGSTQRVRLIGVDTPETVHPTKPVQPFGPEASAFTKAQLTGKAVLLEYDVDQRDQYGRLLAYIYLPNGTMFNGILADEGYARMATFPPNVRYVDVFRALQADAQGAGVGLWGGPSLPVAPPVAPPVAQPAPVSGYAGPYDPFGPDRDCKDFGTQAQAQAFFIAAGGPARDPHRLDADHDGVACETLP